MKILKTFFRFRDKRSHRLFPAITLLAALFASSTASENVVQKNAGAFEEGQQSAALCAGGLKHRVAILSVVNRTPYGQQRIGNSVTDMLTTEIARTGCFVLVEREQLDKTLGEQSLGQSGAVDPAFAPRVGKLVGAEFVLQGSVTQFGVRTETSEGFFKDSKTQYADAAVDVKLVNVETGVIILSLTGTGHAKRKFTSVLGMGSSGGYDEALESQALRSSLEGFTAKIAAEVGKSPWMCYAMVRGEQVFLDAGSRSGVAVGQQYEIFTKGDTIYSPSTGAILGYDEVKTGVVQVDRLLGSDGAIAVLVSGKFPEKQGIVRRLAGKQ
jgi:curli biogenesis system outer membrane secretion channel CsgG